MKHLRLFLFLFLLLFPHFSTYARVRAAEDLFVHFRRWSNLSSEQLTRMGQDYLNQRAMPDSAMVCFSIVANRLNPDRQSPDELIRSLRSLNAVGYLYSFVYYDYPKAYTSLTQAIEVAERMGIDEVLPKVYNNLGALSMTHSVMYDTDSAYHQSMVYYRKGFESAIRQQDWEVAPSLLISMENIALFNNDCASVQADMDLLRSNLPEQQSQIMQFALHLSEGIEAYAHQEYDRCIDHFRLMSQCITEGPNADRYCMSAYNNIAQVYSSIGQYTQAIEAARRVEQMAIQTESKDVQVDISKTLMECYRALGDSQQADRYAFRYLLEKDSLLTQHKLAAIDEMQFLSQLSSANEKMLDLERRQRVQQFIICLALTLVLLIGAFLLILNRRNRMLQQNNRQLYQLYQEVIGKEQEQRELRRKYSSSSLGNDAKEALMARILQVMEDPETYCSESFSLSDLATQVDSVSNYVSQVINEQCGKSFSAFLNDYRIREACRRIEDREQYGQYTIEWIANSVGFRSRSHFVTTFKAITGLTPSTYQKMAHQKG